MMIAAIYKLFSGTEFLPASIDSIYDHVDRIVCVCSELDWLGREGATYHADLSYAMEMQKNDKIVVVESTKITQEEQYGDAIDWIRQHEPTTDLLMAVDADEIWQGTEIQKAKDSIVFNPSYPSYRTRMHTYLKTPFFRVDPPYGYPTVFFKRFEALTESPRGCKSESYRINDAWFHHLSYVRSSWEVVERKMQTSAEADGNEEIVPNYKRTVWDKMPFGQNLHGFKRWRDKFKAIRRVYSELPLSIHQCEAMKLFMPEALLLWGERNVLVQLAKGKHHAIDLGTFKGASAILMGLGAELVDSFDLFEEILDVEAPGGEYIALFENHNQTIDIPQLQWYPHIHVHKEHTAYAASNFIDGSVDLIFVDGDHSYEGTKLNFDQWHRKLAHRGIMLFHDNNDIHPGVQKFIAELSGRDDYRMYPLPGDYGSMIAFEKCLLPSH